MDLHFRIESGKGFRLSVVFCPSQALSTHLLPFHPLSPLLLSYLHQQLVEKCLSRKEDADLPISAAGNAPSGALMVHLLQLALTVLRQMVQVEEKTQGHTVNIGLGSSYLAE